MQVRQRTRDRQGELCTRSETEMRWDRTLDPDASATWQSMPGEKASREFRCPGSVWPLRLDGIRERNGEASRNLRRRGTDATELSLAHAAEIEQPEMEPCPRLDGDGCEGHLTSVDRSG